MNFSHSEQSQYYAEKVGTFIERYLLPVEAEIMSRNHRENGHGDWTKWRVDNHIEALKKQAKEDDLWNLFLPDADLGQGLSCLDYAPVAEQMGKSVLAAELFNCNAPDTGNMEVLYHFGSPKQKNTWLTPLLAGDIRSVFAMTEPDVASSDATNMQTTIVKRGDKLELNGTKWWTTGLGPSPCKNCNCDGIV